jgi:Flp pilus assembly protein TadD
VEVAKLTATSEEFGGSVAAGGDTLVIGAVGNPGDPGAAYVVRRPADGWNGSITEAARLTPSDGAAGEGFGASVAIGGDTVVVGAPGYNGGQGAAYVFVKPAGGWNGEIHESARLTAAAGKPQDAFGGSVAISGDTAVVGAWKPVDSTHSEGSVHVFVKPAGGWSGQLHESARLRASDEVAGDGFGNAVDLSGDVAIVGARHRRGTLDLPQGAAYVFVKPAGGWSGQVAEAARLRASDEAVAEEFGRSVAIDRDVAVVGVLGKFTGVTRLRSSVYVFVKPAGGWSGQVAEAAQLATSDGATGDDLGAVAVGGDTVAVAAQRLIQDEERTRSHWWTYLFVRPAAGWAGRHRESVKLSFSRQEAFEQSRTTAAVGAGMVAVGAPAANIGPGSVHVYAASGDPAGAAGSPLARVQRRETELTSREERIYKLNREEAALERAGEFENAIEVNKRILVLDPKRHETMNAIARLYGRLGQLDQVLEWTQKAIAIAPTDARYRIQSGNALLALKRLDEAATAFDAATVLNPDAPAAAYGLGLVEERRKNFAKALEHYQKSVEIDPKFASGYFNLAAMCANLKRFDEAIAALQTLLKLEPDAKDAKALLARIEEAKKREAP